MLKINFEKSIINFNFVRNEKRSPYTLLKNILFHVEHSKHKTMNTPKLSLEVQKKHSVLELYREAQNELYTLKFSDKSELLNWQHDLILLIGKSEGIKAALLILGVSRATIARIDKNIKTQAQHTANYINSPYPPA